jgi:hypothetical protein
MKNAAKCGVFLSLAGLKRIIVIAHLFRDFTRGGMKNSNILMQSFFGEA